MMWSNFIVITEFEIRALWSDKSALIRMLIEPIAYLFLLTAGLGSMLTQFTDTSNYISFVYPGIVALQVFRIFVHSMYRLTIDRRWGLQAIKMVSGTGKCAYLAGNAMVPIVLSVIQIVITYPCSLLLGAKLTLNGFALLVIAGIVSALFWTFLAMIFTFYFKKYSQRDLVINFLFLPLSLAAPIFYSLEKAPKYLQMISHFNPLSYQVEAMRHSFLERTFSWEFYIILLITLLFGWLAFRILSTAEFLPSEMA